MDLDGVLNTGQLAVGFIRGSMDIGKELWELGRNPSKAGVPAEKVAELTMQLNDKLLRAQQAQLELASNLLQLKTQIMQTERRLELERNYEPFRTGTTGFVLVTKAGHEGPAGRHYICPHCAEKGVRSFLQPAMYGDRHCQPCGASFSFDDRDFAGGGLNTGHDVTNPYSYD
jgi:hypothetical protein